MIDRRRIAVAMSGGVDSSVTAALLLEQGWQVSGLTGRFWREQEDDRDVASARAVCQVLGIAHRVVDLRAQFYELVVQRFVLAYASARTPNPCIYCNRELKFGLLMQQALASGADVLATGHYARIERDPQQWKLRRGVDSGKDQSYFLYMLNQQLLPRLQFPLGDWHKADVVQRARELGLPTAERPESQDVCFVADGDYRRFVRERAPEALRAGPIVDLQGRELGRHGGLALYTVGQREGLGIAAGEPLYVIELNAARNALVVGAARELGRPALLAEEMTFVSGAPPAGDVPLQGKIRHRAAPSDCHLELEGSEARITFASPLRDITPGQAIVLYNGDTVIGGGTILRSLPG